jgi:hypothetical protein
MTFGEYLRVLLVNLRSVSANFARPESMDAVSVATAKTVLSHEFDRICPRGVFRTWTIEGAWSQKLQKTFIPMGRP